MKPKNQRGFTLIEVAIALIILGILLVSTISGFQTWLANSRVRSVAESLSNDLRRAQSAAVERHRQVAFILTNDAPTATTITPTNSALNWSIRVLPSLNSDEGSSATSGTTKHLFGNSQASNSDTTVTSEETALCFNSVGRLTATANTIADAGNTSCSAPVTSTPRYLRIQNSHANRPLWLQVSLGGQLRMCDPNKTLPDQPDACCTSQCCGLSSATYCIY